MTVKIRPILGCGREGCDNPATDWVGEIIEGKLSGADFACKEHAQELFAFTVECAEGDGVIHEKLEDRDSYIALHFTDA